jgi:hypothetical protein
MVRAMQAPACVDLEHRRAAVASAASKVARLNAERDDDFQDGAMAEIRLAQDAFRVDVGAELPPAGTDALLDALMELARSLDAAPELVAARCDAALEAAGVPVHGPTGATAPAP